MAAVEITQPQPVSAVPLSAVPAVVTGLCLVLSQFAIVRLYAGVSASQTVTIVSVLPLVSLLTLPMLMLLGLAGHIRRMSPTSLVIGVVALIGVAMRVPYFGAEPLLEDDHFRYLLDGALVAHGYNPHTWSPEDLLTSSALPAGLQTLVEAGRHIIAQVNFPPLRSMYPGSAQLVFAAAHFIAPWSLDGLRLVMLLFEAATFAMLIILLQRLGRSPLWAGLYWCNPLMAFTLTGQAHVDAALPPLILGALLLAQARRPLGVGMALGLAVGVKLWPVLLAPLLARMLGPHPQSAALAALSGALVTLALCLPVVLSAVGTDSGLTAYASGWSINNGPFAWLSWWVFTLGVPEGERWLRLILALIMGLAALGAAIRPVFGLEQAIGRALFIGALLFYLSPAQFPWYAAWFIPLAAATGNRAVLLASATLPVYYLFFPLAAAGQRDIHGYGLAFLHLAPVLVALVVSRLGRTRTLQP